MKCALAVLMLCFSGVFQEFFVQKQIIDLINDVLNRLEGLGEGRVKDLAASRQILYTPLTQSFQPI